ncbi:hypothetical protein SAMN05428959_10484 [Duganella sp. CF517]|uniref:hypothetical protein n=1 Tax=Duganella sp. CF517 TaxID=1881038 RepID=UPI0008B1EE5B|nr:hypothetical protein [Duganella sp. CF517]SEN99566.1 hypothetical protein SAMN05428959_10484 [Duganella sp. CF517]
MASNRRAFFKVGLAGAAALAAGGAVYRLARAPTPGHRFALDGAAATLLTALIPSMLGPVLPSAPGARAAAIAHTVDHVGAAIAGLAPAAQTQLHDLFGMLSLAPVRRLLAGVAGGWPQASPDAVDAFLHSWRHHRLRTLQTAYLALHDLITGAWYAQPANWAAIGYPGPIKALA